MEDKRTSEEKYDLVENKSRNKKLSTIGVVLAGIGFISFLIGFLGIASGDGRMFIFSFFGIILLIVGQFLFNTFGRGRMARFYAKQTTPVKKDVTNYLLDETKDNLKEIYHGDNKSISKRACLNCGAINPIENKFCGNCGHEIGDKK